MIKAVIFDCFGVLAKESWVPFRDKNFRGREKVWADQQMRKATDGEISMKQFVGKISEKLNTEFDTVYRTISDNSPNSPLLRFVTELKKHYQVGLLSNAGSDRLKDIFSSEQLSLFNAIALSYQIGVSKPDKKSYQIMANKLSVQPEECLFIDDSEKYCDGARAAGMKAIQFTDAKSCIQLIEKELA